MKKNFWIVAGVIILIILVIIIGGKNNLNDKGPIKIGYIGPLSGDAAVYGETEKYSTETVVNKINAEGGINGRQVQVIYEDGKCNGKDALTAASKLINVDKVKLILGGICSSETLAIAPIAEQNKVILFSSFSSNPAIANSGDYVFRNGPSDSDVAKLDANVIVKGGFKKVALISENNDYAQGVRKIMVENFNANNVQIVFDQNFEGKTTDFRDVVMKIKEGGADVVYVCPGSSGKPGALLVKQLRQAGFTGKIHGNFSLGTPDSFAVGGTYLEGVVLSDGVKNSPALEDLISKYQQKFGSKPVNATLLGLSFDRANVTMNAIKAVGYDSGKIKNYLYGVKDYNGVNGTFGFDKNGDVTGGPFFTEYVIQNQKEVPFVQ